MEARVVRARQAMTRKSQFLILENESGAVYSPDQQVIFHVCRISGKDVISKYFQSKNRGVFPKIIVHKKHKEKTCTKKVYHATKKPPREQTFWSMTFVAVILYNSARNCYSFDFISWVF